MTAPEVESELVVAESTALEPSGENARVALRTYLDIQKVFDAEMPDAIMEIEGKKFRKKSYWRGVGTTFHVRCKIVEVKRVEFDDDWGYEAIVCATTNDGRSSDGDGACMASEKTKRDGSPSKMQSVHNVRSHAVTRAKNRAISDLVGFGEVSADELPLNTYTDPPPPDGAPNTAPRETAPPQAAPSEGGTLSKARIKALGVWRAGFKASEAVHGEDEKAKWNSINWALERMGYDKVDEVPDERGLELVSLIVEYPQHQSGDEINF
jgi:hypothetical protein